MSEKLPKGIYGITGEKYSRGRSNVEVVEAMIRGGVRVIQYREKHRDKSIREMFEECLAIREITRKHGVMFIVNDFVDIALLTNADGVHVGQDDLPIHEVRRLMGHRIVGVSTHSPQQAEAAVRTGADYIGVGPIFETRTKEDVCDPVGLSYLEYAVANVTIPFVAIGGIKEYNIQEVVSRGAESVCMVTEIVGAEDIEGTVRRLSGMVEKNFNHKE
jgi:thiamine-phosphate pyrophosphorylase